METGFYNKNKKDQRHSVIVGVWSCAEKDLSSSQFSTNGYIEENKTVDYKSILLKL